MEAKLMVGAALALSLFLSYRLGYERAEAVFHVEQVRVAQEVKDAVSRATDALLDVSKQVKEREALDDAKLKEIEDAANADGTHCYVPAERLRGLDAIG